ncbi:MAG: hypothetical protein QOH64_1543, partial [Acidimicrobiaceae bacterium]
ELITHDRTGFIAGDADDATRAVDRAGSLDRNAIRASTVKRFDRATMVDKYAAVYHEVLAQRRGQ